jgi:hypothetical protein
MNKKVIVLITAITCCLLIILVSVLGAVPEDSYRTPVSSIEFTDITKEDLKCELTNEGEKIIGIARGTKEYQLTYQINPTEATEKEVYFFLMCDESVATVNELGVITFHKEITVTAKIVSNYLDFKIDYVIIEFRGNIQSDITDNPF